MKNSQFMTTDASTSSSKTLSKQPVTGPQEPPVQVQTQTEISNRFQNLSMEYMPVFHHQPIPPYYNFPSVMFHPMYYANPEQIRFVHPSGIPIPRHIPIGTPQSQSNIEASHMVKKDDLELDIGLPPPPSPPQATGATDMAAHGVIHVK
ncbi:unnamed protein product [Thlaspi arvense]|uniref:Uncharacterized protein n=1 Tax=Thlaspi arvense TaxID=13288 RepID=A0AAU9RIL3_THLAR|nr:unnamed protein product [Thlaspi arvense]